MDKPHLSQSMIITGPAGYDLLTYAQKQLVDPHQATEIQILEHKKKSSSPTAGIYVDDIRTLQESVKTRKQHQKIIVLFDDAANMTGSAQVAMLKLLEEPRQDLYLVLLTSRLSGLLETIVSRCQVIKLQPQTVASYDPQVNFMSRGVDDEAKKLTTNKAYRQNKQKQYQLAKQFISSNAYSKLQIVISIQKLPRDEVIGFVDAAIHISSTVLKSKPTASIIRQTEILLEVAEALRQNGNVRTQLLRIVL